MSLLAWSLLLPLSATPQEPARTLDTVHRFETPEALDPWEERRGRLRTQVLLAAGLWPLPGRRPLAPVIHGAVDRGDYTVEKVYFASLPGHYVTGNLYRPTAPLAPGASRAAVLSPHGHWADGRFVELDDEEGNDRWPLQARCAQLARLGCVVFHYDMVGYGDSTAVAHQGFGDAEAIQAGMTLFGLQLWNSIRALDFLCALPEVDPTRVGVTGASGGGTQTFMLCAVDDRPAAAFPAVMVSSRMQGGCECENAPYLRVGTDNVELAALFAPKPLALSGANDWTIAIETEGLPELKHVWSLYGAEDKVTARCWPELDHNFAQPSRAMMYAWFNEHLGLGHEEPIVEAPIEPLSRAELTVFDDAHPRPRDERGAAAVRSWWSARNRRLNDPLPEAGVDAWLARRAERAAALDTWLLQAQEPAAHESAAHERTEEPVCVAFGPAGDPEYDALLARLAAVDGSTVLRMEPPPLSARLDRARHAAYAGYSWCYNLPAALVRAFAIGRSLVAFDDVRVIAYGEDARAAALAVALDIRRRSREGGLCRALFIAEETLVEPNAAGEPDFLPGSEALGGRAALLALGAPIWSLKPREGERIHGLAFVQAAALPAILTEAYSSKHAAACLRLSERVDDELLRWLLE